MVRPKHFGYNTETAVNNEFQSKPGEDRSILAGRAVAEFDHMVGILRNEGVHVEVVPDSDRLSSPDAVFPNNWISTHSNGAMITYPMFAENRRAERREDIIEILQKKFGFTRRYSLEQYESQGIFLEGTGSLVLDRLQEVAYACLGPRTDPTLLDKWCVLTGYDRFIFQAEEPPGSPIYHTNVMMSIGTRFAVVCLESITDSTVRSELVRKLSLERTVIPIERGQMQAFAGNILELRGRKDHPLIVMSSQAFKAYSGDQRDLLSQFGKIIHIPIDTIEYVGGGSTRCMIAELFVN